MYLSVIIPSYNEESRIKKTLESIAAFLSKQDYQAEVLVICDGAIDKTAEISRLFSGRIYNLRIIENKENHGKGYVTRQGMLEAKGERRVFMDADNSTSLNQVDRFLPFFEEGYDVVIGDRDLKESKIAVHQSRIKELLGDFGNFLIQILAVPGIEDTQCGFKVFSKKASERIFPKMTIDRWGFDIEALALANKFGFKIKTVPIVWINDPNSKVKLSGYINTFVELFKIKWNLMTGKYGE
ncbi:glycosyltransferase family 2 protein [Patescibacteria group bacterium]|nr:glycosyltransferase family 2 protein [Patescibacteria group bacterium]MBU4580012.1 glycosyltransferase family 2 protein [Patescibacteria group bacterium]